MQVRTKTIVVCDITKEELDALKRALKIVRDIIPYREDFYNETAIDVNSLADDLNGFIYSITERQD